MGMQKPKVNHLEHTLLQDAIGSTQTNHYIFTLPEKSMGINIYKRLSGQYVRSMFHASETNIKSSKRGITKKGSNPENEQRCIPSRMMLFFHVLPNSPLSKQLYT